jgi:carbon-monoxide dehydrogenase large subunit
VTLVGAAVSRLEDDRLVRGAGHFVADVRLDGMVEVAFVRSRVPHARVRSVDTVAARALEGVLAVVTAADLAGVAPFPDWLDYARPVAAPLLCEHVRYVGAPIAAVVAADRYLAEDAAELVEVGYDELPAVATIAAALEPGAPRLFPDWPDNRVADHQAFDPEVEEALRAAPTVVRGTYRSGRHSAVPVETRGAVAEHRDGRLTVWSTTQSPHIERTTLALVLGVPEETIRVVAPDVGGGFGVKSHVYPEHALVPWLALRLGRPVRWIEDRGEHMTATCHARDQVHELEAAVDGDGRITALRSRIVCDVGSGELFFPGVAPSFVAGAMCTGPYRIDKAESSVTCVVTNKTPSGAYRGFGLPEAVFALERLVDRAARAAGVSPVDARRRMLLEAGELPYTTPSGARIDSGSHREAFELVVARCEEALAAARANDPAVRVGVGYANVVEGVAPTYYRATGRWKADDACTLRLDPDGRVVASAGVSGSGQGVETMVATLAAEALGLSLEAVAVELGDTDACPYGLGGWGSRSTVVAGGAILEAAAVLRAKVLAAAGRLLEAAPEDLVLAGGVHVAGAERRRVTLAEIADAEPGLEAGAVYDPPGVDHELDEDGRMNASATYVNGAHGAVVAVDVETGAVRILDYAVAHDCGTVLNPALVAGQIHGGVAQGIGGALYEELPYGSDGQPRVRTLADYLAPTATEIPHVAFEQLETPGPELPLGAKGTGEAGAIGPAAAIANAVSDALADLGVEITETPITPAAVRRLIREARAAL